MKEHDSNETAATLYLLPDRLHRHTLNGLKLPLGVILKNIFSNVAPLPVKGHDPKPDFRRSFTLPDGIAPETSSSVTIASHALSHTAFLSFGWPKGRPLSTRGIELGDIPETFLSVNSTEGDDELRILEEALRVNTGDGFEFSYHVQLSNGAAESKYFQVVDKNLSVNHIEDTTIIRTDPIVTDRAIIEFTGLLKTIEARL